MSTTNQIAQESRYAALWRVQDISEYLQVHPKDVYRLVQEEGLPCIRIGRRLRFARGDVEQWLRHQKEG